MSEPKHGDYFVCQHVDGFIVRLASDHPSNGTPMLIVSGAVATTWEMAVIAIKYGWRLKAGLPDKSIIVERRPA